MIVKGAIDMRKVTLLSHADQPRSQKKGKNLLSFPYASFILYGEYKDVNQGQHFELEKLVHKYVRQKSKSCSTLKK